MTTSPTRVDTDVLEAAKVVGTVAGRSASQQVSHWARLGKQLEEANALNGKAIARVLAGKAAYDSLSEFDQAAVRAVWEEQIEEGVSGLNYEEAFIAAGEGWAEADEQGNLIIRNAADAAE